MKHYTLEELEAMNTLATGQADNLKIEDMEAGLRVWLSRCTVEDGEPYNNKVTVEQYDFSAHRWETTEEYQAQ
jgi:hypothetical protein